MKATLVENPAWVTGIVADSYEMLEDRIDAKWLPKLDRVKKTRGNKLEARATEYGCGVYGCVLPTLDPKVVIKVTTDKSEAEFAAKMADQMPDGLLVKYHVVFSLAKQHKGQPVYLLWRDSAESVGKLGETLGGDIDDPKAPGGIAELAIHKQHMAAQEVLIAHDKKRDVSAAIEKWKVALTGMSKIAELRGLASGMRKAFDEQGVFLGDVHGGNIGEVNGRWVIVDPGNVVVFDKAKKSNPSDVCDGCEVNPAQEGLGSWKAIDIFRNTVAARMLRMLWEAGKMTQAEFMQRYHRVGGRLDGEIRDTRMSGRCTRCDKQIRRDVMDDSIWRASDGGDVCGVAGGNEPHEPAIGRTAFLNNLGRYTRGHSWIGPGAVRDYRFAGDASEDLLARRDQLFERARLYLKPIVRYQSGARIDADPQGDPMTRGEQRELRESLTGNIILHWEGPTWQEWIGSLTAKELDKAWASMERLATSAEGDDLDAVWLGRLSDEMKRRGLGTGPKKNPARKNPPVSHEQAVAQARELLSQPCAEAIEIFQDLAETRGLEPYELLMEATQQRTGEIVRGAWETSDADIIEWQVRRFERHSSRGGHWSPLITVTSYSFVLKADYGPNGYQPRWNGGYAIGLWSGLGGPSEHWAITPANPRRLEEDMAAAYAGIGAWAAWRALAKTRAEGSRHGETLIEVDFFAEILMRQVHREEDHFHPWYTVGDVDENGECDNCGSHDDVRWLDSEHRSGPMCATCRADGGFRSNPRMTKDEAAQKFKDIIRQPGLEAMEVAQDLALEYELNLTEISSRAHDARNRGNGDFALGALNPADAPVWRVDYNISQTGLNLWVTELEVWINAYGPFATSPPHYQAFGGHRRLNRVDAAYSGAREYAMRHAALDAWLMARYLKALTSDNDPPEVARSMTFTPAITKALADIARGDWRHWDKDEQEVLGNIDVARKLVGLEPHGDDV